ncbi:outer membrane lipoprotein-sorting protein [Catalinimonas alkaloidigena]|uniref:outer membrane lipoprotein-sorting protein n=1 Tax=Catalinimonas alkaloidigena TaxID=1075417 RepID=UPI002405A744|nr:outer membrane lipoprotein-sorting protein [Catalinimonas alkaloidigena]MDF9796295.1 outer membrane lipoprotein-sorting protein [Catalinimonas alkaloidigena]
MKYIISVIIASMFWFQGEYPDANQILEKVDQNMISKNQVYESKMTVHGRRSDRVITSKGWTQGDEKALTEYLSPAREEGTKMLKLEDQLWIYSPSSDRTILISGHMLRQSVMGSDLSYEDMMEDRKLQEIYTAQVTGEEDVDGRKTWVMELEAKVDDAAYQNRKIWVDQERFVPLKEELYAKSGQLLKKTTMQDVAQIDGRWYPKTVVYKDMLKEGEGTEFTLVEVKFDQDIPEYIFSKAALKR